MTIKVLFVVLILIEFGASQDYNCTREGRFRFVDSTCRSYYLCALYQGNLVKSDYTCPSTMIFNPTSQTCTARTASVCIDNVCDGLPLVPLLPKLPDPNGPDCKTYILCAGILNRYPIIQTCDYGFFDQNLNPEADCWLQGDCST